MEIPYKREINTAEMEMRKKRMVRIPNRGGEEEGIIMNPDSSSDIYVTASVEAECRLIAQNRKMKEEDKIKMIKVNALKRAAHMNQSGKSPAKLVKATVSLPNDMMASEEPSTPLLLQVLLYLSTDIIKNYYQHIGRKMGELPDLKKWMVAAAIVQKWGERIWVMGRDTRVS